MNYSSSSSSISFSLVLFFFCFSFLCKGFLFNRNCCFTSLHFNLLYSITAAAAVLAVKHHYHHHQKLQLVNIIANQNYNLRVASSSGSHDSGRSALRNYGSLVKCGAKKERGGKKKAKARALWLENLIDDFSFCLILGCPTAAAAALSVTQWTPAVGASWWRNFLKWKWCSAAAAADGGAGHPISFSLPTRIDH